MYAPRGGFGLTPQTAEIALKQASDGYKFYKEISGYLHSSKEPDRLKQNDVAYQKARRGELAGLEFLRARMDDVGKLYTVTGFPEQIGGWATDSARNDAEAKYNSAVSEQGLNPTIPGTGIPAPGNNTMMVLAALALGGLVLFSRRRRG